MTMFRSLPFHVSLRVWDYFFYEGTIALITVSLALTSIFSGTSTPLHATQSSLAFCTHTLV
jgi:hypothetical protein